MRNNKKGISLIVLVITIIVMIILAASVVITLSNTGIIEKAGDAVDVTSLKEVEQLASLTWAEEFMEGKRGETLKSAVLEKLEDYTDKYTITVTDTGVSVIAGSAKRLNEYGFYYDTLYEYQTTEDYISHYNMVLKADGTVEWYYYCPQNRQLNTYDETEKATYEKGKIIFEDGWELSVSEDGKTLVNPEEEYKYSDIEYHDVYYNQRYYSERNRSVSFMINTDNTMSFYYDEEVVRSNPGSEIAKESHFLRIKEEEEASVTSGESISPFVAPEPYEWGVSADGKIIIDSNGDCYVLANKNEIIIYGDCIGYNVCKVDEGMTWEQWVNSSYNTLGIIIDAQGRVITTCCESHQSLAGIAICNTYHMQKEDLINATLYICQYLPN